MQATPISRGDLLASLVAMEITSRLQNMSGKYMRLDPSHMVFKSPKVVNPIQSTRVETISTGGK
jgi:hypothetical protein